MTSRNLTTGFLPSLGYFWCHSSKLMIRVPPTTRPRFSFVATAVAVLSCSSSATGCCRSGSRSLAKPLDEVKLVLTSPPPPPVAAAFDMKVTIGRDVLLVASELPCLSTTTPGAPLGCWTTPGTPPDCLTTEEVVSVGDNVCSFVVVLIL